MELAEELSEEYEEEELVEAGRILSEISCI